MRTHQQQDLPTYAVGATGEVRIPDPPASNGNILLVAHFDSDVGFAWWLVERYWAAIGHAHGAERRVLLAYPSISRLPSVIENAPIECVELDARDRSAEGVDRLVEFVRANRIKSIYWTDGPFIDRHYDALRRAGVEKIVVHTHRAALPTTGGPLRRATKRLMHRWGGYSADHYIAVSPYVQQTIESNAKVPAKKTLRIGSGVDVAGLDAHPESELKLPAADIRLVMMGRIDPGKGVDFAIDVMKRLRQIEEEGESVPLTSDGANHAPETQGPRIRLVHLGTGTLFDEVERRIHAEGLGEYFQLLGYQRDVGGILRRCQLGFHPSDREVGYSLAILEMLSQRLPVVIPDNESVSCSIQGTQCWEGYSESDVEAAAQVILSLAIDSKRRAELGANGRELIEREFDLGRSLNRFNETVVPLFCEFAD